jgi:hypothetical protein
MDKKEVIAQLAGRMEASEQQAENWLEAVLELINGTVAVSASLSGTTAPDSAVVEREKVSTASAPVLRSITPTARLIMGDEIALNRFPFRVGREARKQRPAGILSKLERRPPIEPNHNELYVKDFGKVVNVSREHFQIEEKGDGSYELVDRGSACGTIVGNNVVGGNFSGGRCPLMFGDAIIVGTRQSEIVFEFSQANE